MDVTPAEKKDALDWFFRQALVYPNEEPIPTMKFIKGDVNFEFKITADTLSVWMAAYHKCKTPQEPPRAGRKFKE